MWRSGFTSEKHHRNGSRPLSLESLILGKAAECDPEPAFVLSSRLKDLLGPVTRVKKKMKFILKEPRTCAFTRVESFEGVAFRWHESCVPLLLLLDSRYRS